MATSRVCFVRPVCGVVSVLLSRLAVGVALVSLSLSRGFIADHSSDQVVGLFARLCLGSGRNVGCLLILGSFGADALLLLLPRQVLKLDPIPLLAPFVPGRGCRQTLCLPRKAGRFCGILLGLVVSKLSGSGVGSGGAAVSKIVVFGVSQASVL